MSRGFNTSMLDAVAALGNAATSPSSRHSGWSDSDESDDGGPPEPVPTPARRASRPPARQRISLCDTPPRSRESRAGAGFPTIGA